MFLLPLGLFVAAGCAADQGARGSACSDDDECEEGLCLGVCRSPEADDDHDGLSNRDERTAGTDPDFADTDRDGILDGAEALTDGDGDGVRDAVESALADADGDCIPDQRDPDDQTPNANPDQLVRVMCRTEGACRGPLDGFTYVTATCRPATFAGATINVLTCDYHLVPGWEGDVERSCDGIDNDCDGATDEDLGYLDPSGSVRPVGAGCRGVGACHAASGVVECGPSHRAICSVNAEGSRPAGAPYDVACDGVDNDCDGRVDDTVDWQSPIDGAVLHYGEPCRGIGACGVSAGVVECDRANLRGICSTVTGGSADASSAETCNGIDDDCDGETDEGLGWVGPLGGRVPLGGACGVGACAGGEVVCNSQGEAICSTADRVAPEACNGLDDDCDGRTDEASDLAVACPTVGVCASLELQAVACDSSYHLVCDFAPAGVYEPASETRCNGLDDDCDGETDEGLALADGTGIGLACHGTGACAGDVGTVVCAADGRGVVCSASDDAKPEACNGVDDDCDGETDEGVIPEAVSCSGLGVCAPYTATAARCADGAWQCAAAGDPAYEAAETRCDGLDNDCDGETDEALPTDPTGKWSVVPGREPADRRIWPVVSTPWGPYLFGGVGQEALTGEPRVLGDFWRYDAPTATWNRQSAQGPTVRGGHAMVWDPWSQTLIVQGGFASLTLAGPFGADGGPMSSMWSYAPATSTWTLVEQDTTALADPSQVARRYHVLVSMGDGHILLHGGLPSGVGADGGVAPSGFAVALDGALTVANGKITCKWKPLAIPTGGPLGVWRFGHRAAFDPQSGVAVIGGGIVVHPDPTAPPTSLVVSVPGSPGAWTGVAAPLLDGATFPALFVVGHQVVVQGDGIGAAIDTTTAEATPLVVAANAKVRGRGGAFFVDATNGATNGLALLEGGDSAVASARRTTPLDLATHAWGPTKLWTGPPPRVAATLVDIEGVLWMLGGVRAVGGEPLEDAWHWDVSRGEWAMERAPDGVATGPRPALEGASGAWDPSGARVWLWDDSSTDRLWTYDPIAHAFAYDQAAGEMPTGQGILAGMDADAPIIALQASSFETEPVLWRRAPSGVVPLDAGPPSSGALVGAGVTADAIYVLYAEADAWVLASWSKTGAMWTVKRYAATPRTLLHTGAIAAWDAAALRFHTIGVVALPAGAYAMRMISVDTTRLVETPLDASETPLAPALAMSDGRLVGFGGPYLSGSSAAQAALQGNAGPVSSRTFLFAFACRSDRSP